MQATKASPAAAGEATAAEQQRPPMPPASGPSPLGQAAVAVPTSPATAAWTLGGLEGPTVVILGAGFLVFAAALSRASLRQSLAARVGFVTGLWGARGASAAPSHVVRPPSSSSAYRPVTLGVHVGQRKRQPGAETGLSPGLQSDAGKCPFHSSFRS